MTFGCDQNDELSVLDSDDGSLSPQDILKWIIAGEYILKKNTKGSRTWEQFQIMFNLSRD